MEPLALAIAIANKGLEGCAHARFGGKRQVLLVDRETLNAMDLHPGVIRGKHHDGRNQRECVDTGPAPSPRERGNTGSQRSLHALRPA